MGTLETFGLHETFANYDISNAFDVSSSEQFNEIEMNILSVFDSLNNGKLLPIISNENKQIKVIEYFNTLGYRGNFDFTAGTYTSDFSVNNVDGGIISKIKDKIMQNAVYEFELHTLGFEFKNSLNRDSFSSISSESIITKKFNRSFPDHDIDGYTQFIDDLFGAQDTISGTDYKNRIIEKKISFIEKNKKETQESVYTLTSSEQSNLYGNCEGGVCQAPGSVPRMSNTYLSPRSYLTPDLAAQIESENDLYYKKISIANNEQRDDLHLSLLSMTSETYIYITAADCNYCSSIKDSGTYSYVSDGKKCNHTGPKFTDANLLGREASDHGGSCIVLDFSSMNNPCVADVFRDLGIENVAFPSSFVFKDGALASKGNSDEGIRSYSSSFSKSV